MTKNLNPIPPIRETISGEKVQKAIDDLIKSLVAEFDFNSGEVALVGIQTRGAILARRVAEVIRQKTRQEIFLGDLDISLYRDDFSTKGIQPVVGETNLNFDVDGKKIVLIDDVLFTGRTVRAAIDQIMDYGRPQKISLAVLIDRGHRELPIAADFAPVKISTQKKESVNLQLQEVDGKDQIIICDAVES